MNKNYSAFPQIKPCICISLHFNVGFKITLPCRVKQFLKFITLKVYVVYLIYFYYASCTCGLYSNFFHKVGHRNIFSCEKLYHPSELISRFCVILLTGLVKRAPLISWNIIQFFMYLLHERYDHMATLQSLIGSCHS